jgi:hypothetical protein
MWGALSGERTGLSFTRVTVSSNKYVVSELPITFRLSLYRLESDPTENTYHVSESVFIGPLPSTGHDADHIENTSSVVRMHVYWLVAHHWAWRGPHRKHFFQCLFYCCLRVFRALPINGVTCHTTLLIIVYIFQVVSHR